MKRRSFLAGTATAAAVGTAGCVGEAALGRTDHRSELRTEVEGRGIEVRGLEVENRLVRLGYTSETANDDLAEVAMAFVERVADGWNVARLRGLAHSEEGSDMTWFVEAEWAREYINGEIEASEYGQRISETLERTLIIEDQSGLEGTQTNQTKIDIGADNDVESSENRTEDE